MKNKNLGKDNRRLSLFIDTSDNKKIVLGFDKERKIIILNQKEKSLLKNIEKFLEKEGCSLDSIGQIEINPGPGSFTGLRVGFSVANLLGWYLEIPVNSLMVSQNKVALPNYE